MATNILLWGVGTSRTIRPHWALHELGLKYEMRPIQPRTGETKTAEFTANTDDTRSTASCSPVAASQMRAVLSADTVTMRVPSGLKAADST